MKKIVFLMGFLLNLQFSIAQTDTIKTISVGNYYQGGIVFLIDKTGKHGLIAATENQTPKKIKWGPNGKTGALSPQDGQFNTKKIIDYFKQLELDQPLVLIKRKIPESQLIIYKTTAAYICDTLSIDGYSDWYLPAIDELLLMYENRKIIGGFLIGDYCSSTEYGKRDVCSIHIQRYKRVEFYYNKVSKDYYVRCIRKF